MGNLVDLRSVPPGSAIAPSATLTDELATCLERFLDGTADEGTMSRGRRALDAWHAGHNRGLKDEPALRSR